MVAQIPCYIDSTYNHQDQSIQNVANVEHKAAKDKKYLHNHFEQS